LLLDPKRIPITRYSEASTISGAFKYGKKVLEVPKIDLKVTGSVAVDREGGRVGKGHGYSDLEYGILGEIGAMDERTPVATTVHDLQIVERVPMEPQDMPVYLIVTPSKIIRTGRFGKPRILWELITQDIEREVPIIRYLKGRIS
ncbi:MAG: 5-formyltetrahydrofolate cyclo-ligase, partial [Candidatus Korarchaeum sp.]|nr:5-formyltetrahydrofolate cyclo-ligase [Candidatus Korarchaeum sp.]